MWEISQKLKIVKPIICIYAGCIIKEGDEIEIIKLQRKRNKIYLYKDINGGGFHIGKIPVQNVEKII